MVNKKYANYSHVRLNGAVGKRQRRFLLGIGSVLASTAIVLTGVVTTPDTAAASAMGATAGVDFGEYSGPHIVQLAEHGDEHVLGLDDEGNVWGWGVNSNRQVTGTSTGAVWAPQKVTSVTGLLPVDESVIQVAAGDVSSYALTSRGRVISWGTDSSYSLGRNTTAASPNFVLRASGEQLTGIVKISAGHSHVLALDEDGYVWGWGLNTWAQLGLNNNSNQRYAVRNPSPDLVNVTDISAGYYHSVALVGGKVWVWGGNAGYLGVGNKGTSNRTPVPTPVVTDSGMTGEITAIAAGINTSWSHTLAVDEFGQVWSWGYVSSGNLGRDGTVGVPNLVVDTDNVPITGIKDVTAGYYTGYALSEDGTAYAWGQNSYGQLGIGTTKAVNRATKIKNFDLEGDLTDIKSISAGWRHLGIISSVGDDDNVVSMAGHYYRTGLMTLAGGKDTRNSLVPNLVWKFEQEFEELPLTLVPRDGRTYKNGAKSAANLVERDPGTFNYGMTPFVLEGTTAGAGITYPIVYKLSGYCSLNSSTNIASVTYGGPTESYHCNITRSFAGNAMVKPLANEVWRVYPRGAQQEIAALAVPGSANGSDISVPGSLLTGLTADSGRVTLPNNTDAPISQGSIRYTASSVAFPANAGVCALSAYDGSHVNVQRYLQILGAGTCTLRIEQTGNAYYYEPLTKVVEIEVGVGKGAQALDLSELNGIRFDTSQPQFDLPSSTDAPASQPVSYTVAAGSTAVCEVVGAAPDQQVKALSAGDCVLGVTAPGADAGPDHNGFHPYVDTKSVLINRAIQTLVTEGIYDTLIAKETRSHDLPTQTAQGLSLTWGAVPAPGESNEDVCSISTEAPLGVLAGSDAPESGTTDYVLCRVTASNSGDSNYEPFSYDEVVEISEREQQSLDLSVLNGKKFGDDSFPLPEGTTVGNQPVTYTTGDGSSCSVSESDGVTTVTIESGGPCILIATANGTTDPDDGGKFWRPFSTVATAPVATIGQFLKDMPALNALKVGAMSAVLPAQTEQGNSLTWVAAPADKCQVIGAVGAQSVEILADGDCTVSATAPGDDKHSAFAFELTFAGAINYDALHARVVADRDVTNPTEGTFPTYTASSWSAFAAALENGDLHDGDAGQTASSQGEVDGYLAALVAAKDALVDLSELRTTYLERVTTETDYTPNSWSQYATRVAAALAVLNDPDADQVTVVATADELGAATELLVHRADTTLLEQELAAVLVEVEHTVASWARYQAQRVIAQEILDDLNASQDDVDAALEALVVKHEELVSIAELLEVVDAETGAGGHIESDWSSASWSVFAVALAAAQDTLAEPDATQGQVDVALTDLLAAIRDLTFPEQTLTMSSLNGIRFTIDEPEFVLPALTDAPASQQVTYTVTAASAGVCEVIDTTPNQKMIKALHAGDCVLEVSAPGVDVPPATKGFAPFSGTVTVAILKGLQTLDMTGVYDDLTTSDTASSALPTQTAQGIEITNWNASPVEVCSVTGVAPNQVVAAGTDVPDVYSDALCAVSASNSGNDDFEPFSYEEEVEISTRHPQVLDLDGAPGLSGLKYGYVPFTLPGTTSTGGQAVEYSATGACSVHDGVLTILSGGDCILTAEANGTTVADDDGKFWRPFKTVKTVSVATIAQQLSSMPVLEGLVVGSSSDALPTETDEEVGLSEWVSITTTICQVVGGIVEVLADGECTIMASNEGNANYSPFSHSVTFTTAINYTDLNAAVADAIGGTNADGKYTASSWAAYADARSNAIAHQSPNGGTQVEVDYAAESLIEAQAALVDLSELRAEYGERETDQAPYTPDSWLAYQIVVSAALAALSDGEATAEEIADATDALQSAMGDLVLRADFTLLQEEVDLAATLDEDDYAGDSWDAYQDELAEANAVLADLNATQAEVDAALDELTQMREALVSLVALRSAVDAENAFVRTESDYTPDSWADLQVAIADAESIINDPKSTQVDVDAARAALLDAVDALVYTQQTLLGLPAAITDRTVGEAPIMLPELTDRGATVTYTAGPADVCDVLDGKLVINGTGTCTVDWSAPAIGGFPVGSGSASAPTGPGLQLVFDGVQLSENDELQAGQTLVAHGEGLEPGSELRVELHSTPLLLGSVVVGPSGIADVTFTIPNTVPPGLHTLHAFGVSGIDQSALTRGALVRISNLAWTGVEIAPFVAGGMLLLLIGGGLLLVASRRRLATRTSTR